MVGEACAWHNGPNAPHGDVEEEDIAGDENNGSDDGNNTIAKRLRGPLSRKPKSVEDASYVYYEQDKTKRRKEKDMDGNFYRMLHYLFYKNALCISNAQSKCAHTKCRRQGQNNCMDKQL